MQLTRVRYCGVDSIAHLDLKLSETNQQTPSDLTKSLQLIVTLKNETDLQVALRRSTATTYVR
jgi:hypothetical protein